MAQWMPGNSWGRAPQLPSSHCMVHSCKYRVPVLQLPKPADSQLLSLCAEACAPRACSVQFSSVQSLSRVLLFATPWTAAHQASLSITNSQSAPKHHWVSDAIHLILCRPLLLLPSIFPSSGCFQMSQLFGHQVAKVLELQLQHQSFQWTLRTDLF